MENLFNESNTPNYLVFSRKDLEIARHFFKSSRTRLGRSTLYFYSEGILIHKNDVVSKRNKRKLSYNFL